MKIIDKTEGKKAVRVAVLDPGSTFRFEQGEGQIFIRSVEKSKGWIYAVSLGTGNINEFWEDALVYLVDCELHVLD